MILENTNNTRILARKTCILLYFTHGPPVFSIPGLLRNLSALRFASYAGFGFSLFLMGAVLGC